MLKRVLLFSMLCGVWPTAGAQVIINNCPYTQHQNGLACLIPDISKTGDNSNLRNFNTTLAEVLGQLPLAVPFTGGELVLGGSGVHEIAYANLGSVLSERADTLGKNHLFVGFTFQRFTFQSVDGTSLKALPTEGETVTKNLAYTTNSLAANVNQFMGVAAFGLTNWLDVAVTLPFQRVSLSGSYSSFYQASCGSCPFNKASPFSAFAAGSASGIGDVTVEGKANIVHGDHLRIAAGAEARFPTGNEYNLLGSGAYGFKPFLTISRHGRFTPHANLGYQWNGRSALYQSGGVNNNLPAWLEYSAGTDIGIVKRLTFVADLLGQHFFNAPRVTPPADTGFVLPGGAPIKSVGIQKGDYEEDNLAIGLKANLWKGLLFTENLVFKLNDAGLRSKITPLIGLSYRF